MPIFILYLLYIENQSPLFPRPPGELSRWQGSQLPSVVPTDKRERKRDRNRRLAAQASMLHPGVIWRASMAAVMEEMLPCLANHQPSQPVIVIISVSESFEVSSDRGMPKL